MTTWWFCMGCAAGGTENAAATMVAEHTKRTQHGTSTTVSYALWLKKMQASHSARGEGE